MQQAEKNEHDNLSELEKMRSEAIRVLKTINHVDGFDPNLFLHKSTDKNDASKAHLYLPVDVARAWFYAKYPDGRIITQRLEYNAQKATVEAFLYASSADLAARSALANAAVTRFYNENDEYGKDYLQNAATAAIRKALSMRGFCAPLDARYIDGITVDDDKITPGRPSEDLTEPGVIVPNPPPPVSAPVPVSVPAPVPPAPTNVLPEPKKKTPARRGRKRKEVPAPVVEPGTDSIMVEETPAPAQQTQPEPKTETSQVVEATKDTPSEAARASTPVTYAEALDCICQMSGKSPMNGKTMREVLAIGGEKMMRLFSGASLASEETRAAAKIILEQTNRK